VSELEQLRKEMNELRERVAFLEKKGYLPVPSILSPYLHTGVWGSMSTSPPSEPLYTA
jgi:hypothetical protein